MTLTHRPWLPAYSPLRSRDILHLDAYVRGNSQAVYLVIYASLGGSRERARTVLDVTSAAPYMVALDTLPEALDALSWSARETRVPWRKLHRYVREQAEALKPRGLGTYPWLTVSLVCHYVRVTDLDPFKGWRRVSQNANANVSKG